MRGKMIILPRDRLAWHGQVAGDTKLPAVAVRVAIVIGTFFNNRTGKTFVGYNRLADKLGISRATVARAIAKLVGEGHLGLVRGGGRQVANEYSMILKTVSQARPFADDKTVSNGDQNRLTGETTTRYLPSVSNSWPPVGTIFVGKDSREATEHSARLRAAGKVGTLVAVKHRDTGELGHLIPDDVVHVEAPEGHPMKEVNK